MNLEIKEIINNWNLRNQDNMNENNAKFKNAILNITDFIPLSGISKEQVEFLGTGKNIFNKNDVFTGRVSTGGNIVVDESIITSNFTKVKRSTTYYTNQSIWLNFHNSNFDFTDYMFIAKGGTFTTKGNTDFIRISVNKTLIDDIQVEMGVSGTPYEPFGFTFEGVDVLEITKARNSVVKGREYSDLNSRLNDIEIDMSEFVPIIPADDNIAENTFINAMNEKAVSLGFTRPNFKNSSGLSAPGQVTVTKDMLLLIRAATNTPMLLNIWGRKNYVVAVEGLNSRSFNIETTVKNAEFENEYTILGGKTGTLGIVHNLSVVAQHKETGLIAAGNVLRSNIDRWQSIKIALDNAVKNQNVEVDAYGASSFIVDSNTPLTLFADLVPSYIKGADSLQSPASITKILTAIIAIENMNNINMPIVYQASDMVEDTLKFNVGDTVTLKDALHLMMLQSNNTTAKAVARTIGYNIIKSRGFE